MSEQDFYTQWQGLPNSLPPFDLACRGGALAASPAQIFLAGYQAAIRETFPTLADHGWYSFAVTEDRSPDSVRPGVVHESGTVTGHKTWIAGVNCVDTLVLKVGSGEDAVYGTVAASDTGVILSDRHSDFLSDMSQGSAEFRRAGFTQLQEVSGVRQFHQNEPYFIYVSFLARLAQAGPCADAAALELKAQIATPNLVSLDREVTRLVEELTLQGQGLGENWAVDQKLFTMYSKGIQQTNATGH